MHVSVAILKFPCAWNFMQKGFQCFLVVLAALCVPWMMLVKPFYLRYIHRYGHEKNWVEIFWFFFFKISSLFLSTLVVLKKNAWLKTASQEFIFSTCNCCLKTMSWWKWNYYCIVGWCLWKNTSSKAREITKFIQAFKHTHRSCSTIDTS